MRCQHCTYPIFSYARCCPNCSKGIELTNEAKDMPQTRIGIGVVHFRRVVTSFALSLSSLLASNHQQ